MRLRIATMVLACFLCSVALAADKPLDVRDVMTATQFHATGLDKLTPEQLDAFNAWLATYAHAHAPATAIAASAAVAPAAPASAVPMPAAAVAAPNPAPSATSTASFGKETMTSEQRGEPDRIESRILGNFNGWNGRSVFTLENGQVWQQADSSSFDVSLQDPKVVIKRLGLGYLLTLPGHSGSVFVRRIH